MCVRKCFRELSLASIFLLSALTDGLRWVLQAGGIMSLMLTVNPRITISMASYVSFILGKGYRELCLKQTH